MASAPEQVALTREQEHILVAKKMFYGGCAFLPLLWALNAIYFRSSLFNKEASPELKKCT
jgi:presenilin enhancer 2